MNEGTRGRTLDVPDRNKRVVPDVPRKDDDPVRVARAIPRKVRMMLHRIADFFRKLYNRKGFRRGLWIFAGLFAFYYVTGVILYLRAMMNTGVSLGEALRFYFFELPSFYAGCLPPWVGVALGIALGLMWYFSMKRKKQEKTEPDQKTEESPDAGQQEEIIETTHYRYH